MAVIDRAVVKERLPMIVRSVNRLEKLAREPRDAD